MEYLLLVRAGGTARAEAGLLPTSDSLLFEGQPRVMVLALFSSCWRTTTDWGSRPS
jgi:hypothetical protein